MNPALVFSLAALGLVVFAFWPGDLGILFGVALIMAAVCVD